MVPKIQQESDLRPDGLHFCPVSLRVLVDSLAFVKQIDLFDRECVALQWWKRVIQEPRDRVEEENTHFAFNDPSVNHTKRALPNDLLLFPPKIRREIGTVDGG